MKITTFRFRIKKSKFRNCLKLYGRLFDFKFYAINHYGESGGGGFKLYTYKLILSNKNKFVLETANLRVELEIKIYLGTSVTVD